MSNRNKGKNGNGARTQTSGQRNLPAQTAESSRLPAWMGEHPLGRLRGEMDDLFNRFFTRWPTLSEWGSRLNRLWDVDMEETDKEILVRAEAPGFEPNDFDIHVSGNMLTIKAEHKQESEEKQGESWSWERRHGRFQRTMQLPGAVDADKVEAHYRNGVLELHLPRTDDAKRRRIEVKA